MGGLPELDRDALDDAMLAALAEAELAPETGDVPVGAVVLGPDGTLLGRGRNEREATGDPTGHAEVLALRAAAGTHGQWRLSGCTLVVTLEPCVMCAGAVVLSRVDRLVYGARDAKAGAVGSMWDLVRDPRQNHRPEVVPPDLISEDVAARCSDLLVRFFARRRIR
ncbi:tRNA-specific adenosine deaminase [Nocardiopsis terrae]|uniref:tRNA-specific adenosine deaminase n=2 Tax=Nocardiopsis terrae TaxID=372655 RepID=A0ABR9HPB3_9ACTN|nr:tRNA(adenine34) deaminase [Nocardiopsis terrae]GHC73625.1 tRNA-specific adenosine deaminase [Nocardiopsis terrae]